MHRRTALFAAAAVTAAVVPAALTAAARGDEPPAPARYLVGGAAVSIDPTPEMLANHDFFLGGYGFGSGRVANQVDVPGVSDALGDRYATGILGDGKYGPDGDGVHSRSFAVSDRRRTIVLGQIETQGYFDAYKQGPFGINEIRKDASRRIARIAELRRDNGDYAPPVPTASQILVDSDHSHGGPDTPGVWGGVPTSYLKEVHDRTVQSIVLAWKRMQPATLKYGAVHGGVVGEQEYPPQECLDNNDPGCTAPADANADWILTNQFSSDPNNKAMDDEVRVLQATGEDGQVLATYVNYSAHPTVLGSSNTSVTGDYVGRLDGLLQQTYGGFAMDQVGTLGRTQPARDECDDPSIVPMDPKHADATPAYALCKLDSYATRVAAKIRMALDHAQPMTGRAIVAMNSYFLNDPTTSPILAGIIYAGQAIGVPAGRAGNPPWYTGNLIGTSVFSGRIGSVLINGGPGEYYPQIPLKVRELVTADKSSGITGSLNIGTAGDFLGYIIAPLEAYPQPIYSSVANHDDPCQNVIPDPAQVCPSPVDNDNYFFNVSHTFGERLTCDLLRGAGDIVHHDSSYYWSQYDRCPAFINDYELSPGTDTKFPEQPDLYAKMHPLFDHM